jgi:hypothetical protein
MHCMETRALYNVHFTLNCTETWALYTFYVELYGDMGLIYILR